MQNTPLLMLTVAIKYRVPRKIFGLRYSGISTFLIMLTVHILAGWMNLSLHVAVNIGGNAFYYGLMTMGLYLLLFKGSTITKVFLTVLINCGFAIIFYVFLPFAHFFLNKEMEVLLLALQIIEWISTLLCGVELEYVGRKFQNLRRELPADYTIYLTAVIIFVYVAIYSAYDRMLMIYQSVLTLPTALIFAAFAVFGVVIVMIAIFAVDRQVNRSLREQLQIMQTENLKRRELEWRKLSGFRHDIKNHLICLNTLIESEKTEQAIAYMSNLTDTINQFDNPVQTGNDYADALLSVKYAEAVEAKIEVSIEMVIPSHGFINPVDLCCILSNAFDNAIAACKRLEGHKKWIFARAFMKQGQFVIVIKNSKPSYVKVVNGEVFPKEITADHGLGLDNVKSVIQKYDGILNLSADDAFSFSVLLPQLRL